MSLGYFFRSANVITVVPISFVLLSAAISLADTTPAKAPDPASVSIWTDLAALSPRATRLTPLLEKKIAAPVDIAGFIIANEFSSGRLSEFLLTRYPGGCIHVPLPPPSNMIHVVMAAGKTADPIFGKKVVVHGRVTFGGRVDSSYEMVADSVQEFQY
jgi:hypothetical protein